jgi:multidrug efflux pump subunit AcrA (membrane-fusion protein)
VVLTKNADVGDIVTPLGAAANAKASVVTMADMASLVVEADVSESSLALVAVRQPTEIQLDALPGMRFPGRVHMIVPTADRSKASVLVKVAFQALDPRILPEMSAKVAFLEHPQAPGDDRPRTVLGPAAVVERDGRTIVYVLADGTVRARPVTLGERIGDQVEVLDGVASGDKVVVGPPAVLAGLKDGDRVAVAGK